MLEGWPPPIFDPAGPFAGSITTLAWVLLAMAAAVFAVVMAALWIALLGKDRLKARLGGDWVIWAGGIAFPVVVLSLLLFYGLSLTRNLSVAPGADEMRVRVTGEMRSEEHTSELQSLMRISYAVFCLKKKKNIHNYET